MEKKYEVLNEIGFLVVIIAYKAYKRYLSRYAKICRNQKRLPMKQCLLRAEIRALRFYIAELKRQRPKCRYEKNEKRCKKIVDEKIKWVMKRLEKKLNKYESKYGERPK